jgi:hypothetical protein
MSQSRHDKGWEPAQPKAKKPAEGHDSVHPTGEEGDDARNVSPYLVNRSERKAWHGAS